MTDKPAPTPLDRNGEVLRIGDSILVPLVIRAIYPPCEGGNHWTLTANNPQGSGFFIMADQVVKDRPSPCPTPGCEWELGHDCPHGKRGHT